MDEDKSSEPNMWSHQQTTNCVSVTSENNHEKQFYQTHYQPMVHGFDLQSEIKLQQHQSRYGDQQLPSTPDNVHFLCDNNGPFIKIYYDQRENQVYPDVFNNFLPNTQNNIPYPSHSQHHQQIQNPMMTLPSPLQQQHKTPTPSSSVIHHLVTSNLGPGKFGTFGGVNNNNFFDGIPNNPNPLQPPLNISIPSVLEQMKSYSNDDDDLSSANKNVSPNKIIAANINEINSENITPNVQGSSSGNNKKQRIIAEVKPMRMSYSDVVSKNADISFASPVHSTNSSSSSPNTTMPIINNNNNNATKNVKRSYEKKQQHNGDRKSPTTINLSAEKRPTVSTVTTNVKPSTPPSTQKQLNNNSAANVSLKRNKKNHIANASKLPSSKENNVNQRNYKYITDSERSSTIGSEDDDDENENNGHDTIEHMDDDENYYNIRRNVYQGEHHKVEKIKTSSYKKSKLTNSNSTQSQQKKSERSQKRVKVSNRKQKHEFFQKIIASCLEYVYIFAKWLWMLIYDVSYLSFGIIWDHLDWYYQCVMQGVDYVRRELEGNPGRVFISWLQSVWKKFDAKFDKKSKWAFWRWVMLKKQVGNENMKDNFKEGRLPKTAEEAMKSLLNCKEKDAYSILGVSPDCPQEQIKKHYKKIAVLVHPDKNKQPGAEEAFKILQRSFELIGEQESRKKYDENLAKALHTEKAFNELNDLLIQLQTKISEAANTIRCSACCFRHPRKPTGRKAFAARECKTCKIRHAGREGDIWAETSFFGLRWKYLALMEGNVYDITEWALCQRGALSHLQPNSCVVQYKIVLGGNQQQHSQNQNQSSDRFKKEPQVKDNMDDFFLNNIYAGQGPQQHQNPRRRYKKN